MYYPDWSNIHGSYSHFLSLIDVHNDGIKKSVFYADPIMLMFVLFLGRRGTQGKITGWILIGSIRLFSHFKQLLWSRSHANIPAACLKVMWTIQIKSSKCSDTHWEWFKVYQYLNLPMIINFPNQIVNHEFWEQFQNLNKYFWCIMIEC